MDPLAEDWKEKGNKAMKEEKYIEAMLNYTQAIKIDEDNPTYYSNRSLAFLKMQQYYLSLMDAEEVTKRMPKWTKGHFRKGEVQMATEHYEEAIQSYKKALETDPKDKTLQNALEKATKLWKEQTRKEKRIPWFGAMFGIVISVLLVIADEHIAADKAFLQNDLIRFGAVTVITLICYGFGIFYKHFLQSQRCSHFEPPVDLFEGETQTDKNVSSSPTATASGNDSTGGDVKHRKKGRS